MNPSGLCHKGRSEVGTRCLESCCDAAGHAEVCQRCGVPTASSNEGDPGVGWYVRSREHECWCCPLMGILSSWEMPKADARHDLMKSLLVKLWANQDGKQTAWYRKIVATK